MDSRPLWLLLAALLANSNGKEASPIFTIAPSLSTLKEVLKEVPGGECRRQVAVLLEGIRNLTDWALQMADATAKVPSGLLRGNLRAPGDMDECVAVGAEVQNTTLHGKYCLASFHMDSDSKPVARLLDIATAGRRHLELRHREVDSGNGVVVPSPGFVPELSRGEWGVCVPAACSAADVEAALRGLARRLLPSTGLSLDVRVPPLACRTRAGPARPLRAPHYAFAIIVAVLVILSVVGTLWDTCYEDKNGDSSSSYRVVLRAFSLRVGWKRLTSERREELGCIAGIRALASIYLMMTHEIMASPQEPSINKVKVTELSKEISYTPFIVGHVVVDSLVTISATLYSYYVANSIINGKFNYIMTIVHRFIRLSPVYYLLILFYTTFLEYLGDGPHWPTHINYNVQFCRENWIWNVLYISNYANNTGLCIAPSWFLAADMQFVILAPLAVLPLFRWRRGRQLMLALIALSTVVAAVSVFITGLPPIYRFHNTDRELLFFLLNVHTRTHMHASPYLVGLSLGYILHRIKNKNIKLNKGFLSLGWAICVFMIVSNLVGPNYIIQPSHKSSLLDSAYLAIGRLFWSIAVSWIIFACHVGYGGLLNNLLNSYALRVISRLSYLSNLTQFLVLMHNGGHRRTPIWINELTLVHSFFADYMLSMIISFVLFVLVDSPVNLISRSFFFGGASKQMNVSPISNGSLNNKNKEN